MSEVNAAAALKRARFASLRMELNMEAIDSHAGLFYGLPMTLPMGYGGPCRRALPFLCGTLVWLLGADALRGAGGPEAGNESFFVRGTARMRMYMVTGEVREQMPLNFQMTVEGCRWFLRFNRDEGTNQINCPDYCEASFDGTNIYALTNLSSAVALQLKAGARLGPNIATARTYHGDVYHDHFYDETAPIWLTFASGCYFLRRTNRTVEPGFVFDQSGDYGPPSHSVLQADWEVATAAPHYPTRVVYYSSGLTNAIYTLQATTNVGGLDLPSAAKLVIFRTKRDGAGTAPPAEFVEYEIRVSAGGAADDLKSFVPRLPGITAIQSDDLPAQGIEGVPFTYLTSNRWRTASEIRANRSFAAMMLLEPGPKHRLVTFLRIVIMLVFVIPALALIGVRVMRRRRA